MAFLVTRSLKAEQMKFVILATVAVIVATSAQAQTFDEAKACWQDAVHFCSHTFFQRNMATIKDCLVANDTKLGRPCHIVLKAHGSVK